MRMKYRFVCPNCDEECYVTKSFLQDEQTYRCDYCDEVLVLKFNVVEKEFDAEFYFTNTDD
jgi:transposase-like protein